MNPYHFRIISWRLREREMEGYVEHCGWEMKTRSKVLRGRAETCVWVSLYYSWGKAGGRTGQSGLDDVAAGYLLRKVLILS